MDITFHYFAIKTLARKAGFDEKDAQIIAQYSQLVDDFNWKEYIMCSNMPDYIKKDPDCDLPVSSVLHPKSNFNPAMTGFTNWKDYVFLTLNRTQKFTVSPFHFIPPSTSSIKVSTRTQPATIGDGSLISNRLLEAKKLLLEENEPREVSLMRLGMELHTFADTYAHQLFSGYKSWVNDVKVYNVVDNSSNENMTVAMNQKINLAAESAAKSVRENIDWRGTLAIGHFWAGQVPDLTNVSFTIAYKASKDDRDYSQTYSRNNTETFITVSRHILDFLLSCQNQDYVSDYEWEDISQRLKNAFLNKLPEKDVSDALVPIWRNQFPECYYCYNYNQINYYFKLDRLGGTNKNCYSAPFYRYNYIADRFLIDMYGSKPRSTFWN